MYVVHGSYFADNFGDTLLVKLMCDKVAGQVGKENVYLAVDGDKKEQIDIGYPVLPKERRHQATHLIFAGGGYFGEPPKRGVRLVKWYLRNYFRHSYWLKDYPNAKVGVFGVGYGPLSLMGFRELLIKPLKKSQIILLRDTESISFFEQHESLKSKTPKLCVDFALSIKKVESNRYNKIALHVPGLNCAEISEVVKGIAKSAMKGCDIEFILDSGRFDSRRIEGINDALISAGYLGVVNFVDYDNVNLLIDRLAKYSLIITSKLHVGIVSTAMGGKVVSIPRHPKTQRFYKQIGLEEFCVSATLNADTLSKLIDRVESYEPDFKVVNLGLEEIDSEIDLFLK